MAKQKITLKVDNSTYQMTIDSDKEEIYRLAEREVGANIAKLKKTFGEKCDIKDCLAITALQLSINNISMARQSEMDSDDMVALDSLSQLMDKHLNRITPRKKK